MQEEKQKATRIKKAAEFLLACFWSEISPIILNSEQSQPSVTCSICKGIEGVQKLSLGLIKHYAMEMCKGLEVEWYK
jgi:hypothetical protein